jgi:hypothetical protein
MQDKTPIRSAFRSVADLGHAQLIQGLDDLSHSSRANEQRAMWRLLEPALLEHMRLESELLLPEFELVLGGDAARIREEHERIRQLAIRLNDTPPRACLDRASVAELRRLITDCAALEERVLYAWAELCLPQRKKGDFLQRAQALARPTFGAAQPHAAS